MFFLQATCALREAAEQGGMDNNAAQISREDLEDLRKAFNKIGQFTEKRNVLQNSSD